MGVPWHDIDGDCSRELSAYLHALWESQEPLRQRRLRSFSFYFGRVLTSWDQLSLPDSAYDSWGGDADDAEIHAWNLTRSIVDAYVSRVGLNAPEPRWLTDGATVEKQEQARLREQFTKAAMLRARTHQHAKTALWSSAITGVGYVRTMDRGPDVLQRYMRPDTVLHDSADTMDDGQPRCLYQLESMDRSHLLALADPGQREAIQAAPSCDTYTGTHPHRDRVLVAQAWCRALGSSQGRHVVLLLDSQATLVDESWDGPPPISILSYARGADGHVGDSLAGIVEGCARLINRLLWKCVRNHDLLAVPFMTGPRSLEPMMRENLDVRYLPSDEGVPQVIRPEAIPPETLHLIQLCWERGYEISGMSQYAAMGTRPPGIDSGRAIIEHNDLQTMRFSDPERQYEEFQGVELPTQILSAGRRIAESEDGWRVQLPDDSTVRHIDWSDLDQEGEWQITVWPASQLGSTPSGRYQRIEDLVRIGAIDRDEVRQLARLPDLERGLQLTTSPAEMYRYVLERVRSGAWIPPTEYDAADLPQGMLIARSMRARAIVEGDGAGAERIEDWMAAAAEIASPPTPAPAPAEISGSLPASPAAAEALAQAQATLGPGPTDEPVPEA